MSFLQRAKEAAEGAADQAKKVAGEAAGVAGQVASQVTRTAQDPATQEKLNKRGREAVGLARRGVSTVVERIDPGTLAEVIIKATALQEMTNNAAAQEALAVPDLRGRHLGVDPAWRLVLDRSRRRPARRDPDRRRLVRGARGDASATRASRSSPWPASSSTTRSWRRHARSSPTRSRHERSDLAGRRGSGRPGWRPSATACFAHRDARLLVARHRGPGRRRHGTSCRP